MHRSGYCYGEHVAKHQRRRYRLMPGHNPNPTAPPPDPSLWIVHYSEAEPGHQIPVSRIPMTPHVQNTLQQRRYIQQHGQQLLRKGFMLNDRDNWPTIPVPGNNAGSQASSYPNNVISHLSRQQPAYVQPRTAAAAAGTSGPPPAKRARHTDAAVAELQPAPENEVPTIYDDEDVSRGDILDLLTPREVSAMRYRQHHDWLGEVFRSPYDTQQIVPGELGLGRKGELEALTKKFFNAPTEISALTGKGVPPARVGRMEDGKADEFSKLAHDRIAEINTEIEKMKRQHAKRMAKFAKGSELRDAEKPLRTANVDTIDAQSNGGSDTSALDEGDSKIAAIQRKVEATLGKEIRSIRDADCVQKGGLQEKVDDSEQISQEYDFGDQVADLSGQIPAFPTPQDQLSSVEHTPGLTNEPPATIPAVPESSTGNEVAETTDVAMSGMQDAHQAEDGEPEDWVVVGKDGDDVKDATNEELPDLDAFTNDAAMGSNIDTLEEDLQTTAEDLPDFGAAAEGDVGTDFAANDFAEAVDFGALDTAGEALSGYGAGEDVGMGDNTDLGLDDTAFGDAFHSNEVEPGRKDDAAGQ